MADKASRSPNVSAVVGLVLGLAGLGVAWGASTSRLDLSCMGPAPLILPTMAVLIGLRAEFRARRADPAGRGSRAASLALALGLAGLALAILVPDPIDSRTAAGRAQAINNFKQIGLALHSYHQDYGRFPPAVVRDRQGQALYSWRVVILPYLEHADLHGKFQLDEPWDSPTNRALLNLRPAVFAPPLALKTTPGDATLIQALVGPGTAFASPEGEPLDSPQAPANFPHGSSTILVVEAAQPVAWTRPIDLAYSPEAQLPPLGGMGFHNSLAGRPRPIFLALMVDGRVEIFPRDLSEDALRALIERQSRIVVENASY